MVGSVSSTTHHLLVQHVVCAEHGEVMEFQHHGEARQDKAKPVLRQAVPAGDPHGHGCAAQLVVLSGIIVSPPAICFARIAWPKQFFAAIVDAPRGSPLAYAPKTSPPTA